MVKVIVLGAGIVGVSTAYQLAEAGNEVTLIDAEEAAATQTSFANGGQLSYAYMDPLASPALVPKFPKLLLGLDPSFRVGWGNTPRFLSWALQFVRHCNKKTEQQVMRELLQLSFRSREMIHHLQEQHGLAFDYQRTGKLHVYHDAKEYAAVQKKVAFKQSLGIAQEVLSVAQCIEREPALASYQAHIIGGVFSPEDEMGDAHAFSQNLLQLIQQQYNVQTRFGCKAEGWQQQGGGVVGLKTSQGVLQADHYVVALGVHTPKLLKPLGMRIPIYPMKGYSMTFAATDKAPKTSVTDAKNKIVFSTLGGRLRVAGLAHFMGYDQTIHPRYTRQLLQTVQSVLPEAADYSKPLHEWTGLRPMMPNAMPLVGMTSRSNVWLNAGHGMLGWTLAMGTAAQLRETMQQYM